MTDIIITTLAYTCLTLIWSAFGVWLAKAVINVLPKTASRIWNAIQFILVLFICGPIVWVIVSYAIISVSLEVRALNKSERKRR